MFQSIFRTTQAMNTSAAARSLGCLGVRCVVRNKNDGSISNGTVFCGSVLVATTVSITLGISADEKTAKCSGIIGVVGGPTCDARAVLINGLSDLKNNGYDSVGLATMRHDGKGYLAITKFASDQDLKTDSLEMVRTKSQPSRRGHSMGIAHTRWATKGSKTDLNAHPHTDASGRIAIVHNGALYNADALRTRLEAKGCVFWGDTDSEVIAKLIGYMYYLEKDNQDAKCGLKEAVEKALSICEGTWGLAVMCIDEPNKIVVAKHGSPLLIGLSNNKSKSSAGAVLVSSDQQTLSRYTKSILPLEEGEIIEIDATGVFLGEHGDDFDFSRRVQPVGPALSPMDASKY